MSSAGTDVLQGLWRNTWSSCWGCRSRGGDGAGDPGGDRGAGTFPGAGGREEPDGAAGGALGAGIAAGWRLKDRVTPQGRRAELPPLPARFCSHSLSVAAFRG